MSNVKSNRITRERVLSTKLERQCLQLACAILVMIDGNLLQHKTMECTNDSFTMFQNTYFQQTWQCWPGSSFMSARMDRSISTWALWKPKVQTIQRERSCATIHQPQIDRIVSIRTTVQAIQLTVTPALIVDRRKLCLTMHVLPGGIGHNFTSYGCTGIQYATYSNFQTTISDIGITRKV